MTEPPPAVVVRQATDADVAAVVDLMDDVAAEGRWIGREAPIDREATAEQLATNISDPEDLLLVADDHQRVVGMLGLKADGAGHLSLWMFLASDRRGLGIGSDLVVAGLTWARSNPAAHKVILQVWPHNSAALALYRRHGFSVEGYLHRHWRRRDGELWDAVVMGLLVDG